MNEVVLCVLGLTWIVLVPCCWLAWQLLCQNGRMLLRLDELEKRLDELELADPDEAPRSPTEGAATPQPSTLDPRPESQSLVTSASASRFSNRSVARSRIKRDGLKAGTLAPHFRLPRADGRGELSLEELRGSRALLVFSDPHCGPCQTLAPHLEKFHRAQTSISVVLIGRGEPKENRAKVKEHDLTFPVVLQRQWEISRLYAMFATPMAYLLDEQGVILNDVAVGVEPILTLLANARNHTKEKELVAA